MDAGVTMDTTLAFEVVARLLALRSRVLQVATALVQDWYGAEPGGGTRTILRVILQFFSSGPSLGGLSMTIFTWIVVGTIVACTSVALLWINKSNMTLSEMAETLETQARGGSDPDERSVLASTAMLSRTGRFDP
jgi:hypothetical protein